MRRVVIAALLAAGAYTYAPAVATAQDKSSPRRPIRVARCVKYDQGASDSYVTLELRNACSFAVTCSMSWEVRCDSDEPGDMRTESSDISLDKGETRSVIADAQRCGDDGWSVEDVEWTCKKQ